MAKIMLSRVSGTLEIFGEDGEWVAGGFTDPEQARQYAKAITEQEQAAEECGGCDNGEHCGACECCAALASKAEGK